MSEEKSNIIGEAVDATWDEILSLFRHDDERGRPKELSICISKRGIGVKIALLTPLGIIISSIICSGLNTDGDLSKLPSRAIADLIRLMVKDYGERYTKDDALGRHLRSKELLDNQRGE